LTLGIGYLFGLGVIIVLGFFSLSHYKLLSHLLASAIVLSRFAGLDGVLLLLQHVCSTRYPLFAQKSLSAGQSEKNVGGLQELVGVIDGLVVKTSSFWSLLFVKMQFKPINHLLKTVLVQI
jgi:hypothetical protein